MSTGPPQPTGAVAPPPSPSGDVTNPISDDSPVEPSTGQPLPNPGGGDYTGMMQQAKNAWNSSNFQMVQHILTRAIQTQPDNPRAYSSLGELYLYAYNNSGLAMQNFQAAIARGGEAVFHVMHDHSAGTFVTHCRGYLRISANGVRYQPVPASVHAFAVSREQIREARNKHDIQFQFPAWVASGHRLPFVSHPADERRKLQFRPGEPLRRGRTPDDSGLYRPVIFIARFAARPASPVPGAAPNRDYPPRFV